MDASPASSHRAAKILYDPVPPLRGDRKPAQPGRAPILEEAPALAPPTGAVLPAMDERYLPPRSDTRDPPKTLPRRFGAPEPRAMPLEADDLSLAAVPAAQTELPAVTPPRIQQPAQHEYPDAQQQMRDDALEYTSRLLHSGLKRQHKNVREHSDTPSGLRQPTTRESELARRHRAGVPREFSAWKKAIEGDAHFRPQPEVDDDNRAEWLRHGGDAGAHARNAAALISSPEDAARVLEHLNALRSDEHVEPEAPSDDQRRARSAAVHVTGAALELAHSRQALARGTIAPAIYDAARDHVQRLVTAHRLGGHPYVKAAFEADADPEARATLRSDLDVAHGKAHRTYASAAHANAARR